MSDAFWMALFAWLTALANTWMTHRARGKVNEVKADMDAAIIQTGKAAEQAELASSQAVDAKKELEENTRLTKGMAKDMEVVKDQTNGGRERQDTMIRELVAENKIIRERMESQAAALGILKVRFDQKDSGK